jgi:hypothetical protein
MRIMRQRLLSMRARLCKLRRFFLSFATQNLPIYFAGKNKMRKTKVLYDFSRMSVAELNEFVMAVIARMTASPSFPTPEVDLAEYELQRKTMMLDSVAASTGDHSKVALMHDSYDKLKAMTSRQAEYVNFICQGDVEMILSSGFHITSQPSPRTNPMFEVIIRNTPGCAKLKHKSTRSARAYLFMLYEGETLPNDADWKFGGSSSSSRLTITGLTSGRRYWFRSCAILTLGLQSPWTDAISKIIP